MDAPCDSGRRVAGGVGWGKWFGVSGMGDDAGGSKLSREMSLDNRIDRLLVPGTIPWTDAFGRQLSNCGREAKSLN